MDLSEVQALPQTEDGARLARAQLGRLTLGPRRPRSCLLTATGSRTS